MCSTSGGSVRLAEPVIVRVIGSLKLVGVDQVTVSPSWAASAAGLWTQFALATGVAGLAIGAAGVAAGRFTIR